MQQPAIGYDGAEPSVTLREIRKNELIHAFGHVDEGLVRIYYPKGNTMHVLNFSAKVSSTIIVILVALQAGAAHANDTATASVGGVSCNAVFLMQPNFSTNTSKQYVVRCYNEGKNGNGVETLYRVGNLAGTGYVSVTAVKASVSGNPQLPITDYGRACTIYPPQSQYGTMACTANPRTVSTCGVAFITCTQ